MSFLSPQSMIWFIPLGAAIVVLYLLKLRRKERVVSSIMLWQDAVADIQANAPFQKLKKSLLLLLQLVALLLLVGAIARPYVKTKGTAENRIVVILDCSASMQSTDVSPSRFESAKSQALDVVNRMGPGDTMLVITAGAKTRVEASFTSDRKALSAAISRLGPVDTTCNMRQAMVLALSLVAGKGSTLPRIVVFSDGGFGPLTDLTASNAKLDFVRVGRECRNIAITGLDSRKTLSGEQQVFVGLRNFSRTPRAFNVEFYLNDQLLDIREETLAAGESKQEILDNVAGLGGRVTAKLEVKDDLPADNTGSVYLTKPRKASVLLVSKGNVFLENALNLDPRTQLTRSDSVPTELAERRYDLTIFDGIPPPDQLPPGGYILIGTSCEQAPAEMGQSAARPTVIDSAQNHPATAYVDFTNLGIAHATSLKPKSWAVTVVEGDRGPLMVAGARDGRRFVQIGFSLLKSDFPLRVGFPIFIANCLDWLAPAADSGAGQVVRAGRPAYIDVPPGAGLVTVTGPDGGARSVRVTQSPVIFDDTDLAGVYQVTAKGLKREFACNLSSSEESYTIPKDVLTVGEKRFASSGQGVRTNREFYPWLILGVLAVLAFEWYAYHRRL